MGHTAGIHTRSREAAVKYGTEMPASRICVNTPTTHGAIGFSTALPPSMTLGCGSWGGNVTSDNVSPLHLMDIKRVAFETRPVPSVRPAVGVGAPAVMGAPTQARQAPGQGINREQIAAIVDRFLAGRTPEPATSPLPVAKAPGPSQPVVDVEAGNGASVTSAAPQPNAAPTAVSTNGGERSASPAAVNAKSVATQPAPNGHKAVDFVCEDDVRRAMSKNEKIYINSKTIITPAARDMGEAAEVFAKA
jgi:hypothetical protein